MHGELADQPVDGGKPLIHKEEEIMKQWTNMTADHADNGVEMGLIICPGCNEVVATLPTDGVKIIHGYCGREECGQGSPDQ